MAYFNDKQVQLIRKMTTAYAEQFPGDDLSQEAARLELSEAFGKIEPMEHIRIDVLRELEESEAGNDLAETEVDDLVHSIFSWYDHSDYFDYIRDRIEAKRDERASALQDGEGGIT